MNDKEFEENHYDIEELTRYMKVPVTKKLEFLEEMNKFLGSLTPPENKKLWEKLKKEGY